MTSLLWVDRFKHLLFHLTVLLSTGIQVSYDVSRQPHVNRVVEVKVTCTECKRPTYVPLEDEKVYKIAVPSYIGSEGDGYKMIKANAINYHTGELVHNFNA